MTNQSIKKFKFPLLLTKNKTPMHLNPWEIGVRTDSKHGLRGYFELGVTSRGRACTPCIPQYPWVLDT